MTKKLILLLGAITIFFSQCDSPSGNTSTTTNTTKDSAAKTADNNPQNTARKSATFTYHAMAMKDSGMAKLKSQYDTNQLQVICAINRVDKQHIAHVDTIVIPDNVLTDDAQYSPFPQSVPALKDVKKIVFFSYVAEAFGAYENGKLVRWGPSNMGRKKDPTPTGLTYVNWKKQVDTSSVKDEWILKWNVNILNKGGVGFHEYDLPGYPASHSCLRLMDADAEYLYNWVDEWVAKGENTVTAHGTPVMVFGEYPFGGRKPWLALPANAKALDISADDLGKMVQPMLSQIMAEQQKLDATRKTASK
jgi:lipoprotein-anchoring transpeptidase ErfK/SrfK